MRLSKFIKITGLALSFANLAPIYADEQIVWLWEVEKAQQLTEKGEPFMYYIQDVYTLMDLLESPAKYTDSTCKVSKACMLKLLEDPIAIDVINTIELDTIDLVKVKEFTDALQKIISKKESGQPYEESSEWSEIVMPYGEFYYKTEAGYSILANPETDEIKKRNARFGQFLPLLSAGKKVEPLPSETDCLMFHEIDQAACSANISALLQRLSEAGKTDNVFPILYDQESYEAELREMLSNHSDTVKVQSEGRDRSQPSSAVPSRGGSPNLQM